MLTGFGLLAAAHPVGAYGTETDFYLYFAPHAERIAAGSFPTDTAQGPGYPLVLALMMKIAGDVFLAGRIVSVVSAVAAVLLTFAIGLRLFGYWTGIGAAMLVAASPQFAKYAISATSDVFCLAVALAAVLAVLHGRIPLAALLTAYAFLTRYNSISLVLALILVLAWTQRRSALVFAGVFALAIAPWVFMHGTNSPQYLNLVPMMYPELTGGRTDIDATQALAARFHSVRDVIAYDPPRAARAYASNVMASVVLSGRALLGIAGALLALCGLVLALRRARTQALLFVLVATATHFLIVALSHWETRYYFFVLVTYALLAVHAAVALLDSRVPRAIAVLVVATLVIVNAAWSRAEVLRFLRTQPVEILDACKVFGDHRWRVLSRKPNVAYACHQEWVFLPDVHSIAELPAADYLAVAMPEVVYRRPLVSSLRMPPVWVSSNRRLALYRLPVITPAAP